MHELKLSVVLQQMQKLLSDFSEEEKKKILEEVMINNNIEIEVAGNTPGYSKPHSEMLSNL